MLISNTVPCETYQRKLISNCQVFDPYQQLELLNVIRLSVMLHKIIGRLIKIQKVTSITQLEAS